MEASPWPCRSASRCWITLLHCRGERDEPGSVGKEHDGAGRRVLSGRILRGAAERINAVLWFSDLKGFTTIADSVAPEQVIPLLNDYAEVVIAAVHEAGGDAACWFLQHLRRCCRRRSGQNSFR